MISFASIKVPLLALLATMAGLPELAADSDRAAPAAIWEDQKRPFGAPAWLIVQPLTYETIGTADVEDLEVEATEWAAGESPWGGEVAPLKEQATTVVGLTLRIRFECDAHTPGTEAETYAEALRGCLELTENVLAFKALGLGFLSVGLSTPLRSVTDDRVRSVYVMDLRFNANNLATSVARYSRIERAEVATRARVPQ